MYEIKPKALRKLRTNSGLSQQQFGDLLGISRNSISFWERGKKRPRGMYPYIRHSFEEYRECYECLKNHVADIEE